MYACGSLTLGARQKSETKRNLAYREQLRQAGKPLGNAGHSVVKRTLAVQVGGNTELPELTSQARHHINDSPSIGGRYRTYVLQVNGCSTTEQTLRQLSERGQWPDREATRV